MHVMALNASPQRSRSLAMLILEPFVQGLDEGGAEVDLYHLSDLQVGPCLECHDCWFKTPGHCVVQDDVSMLLRKLQAADLCVLSTEIGLGGVSAPLKNLMDRSLPLLEPTMELRDGRSRHKLRQGQSKQRVVLVASCAHWEANCFDLAVAQTRLWCEHTGRSFSGALLRPHAYALPHMMWLGKDTSRVVDAAREAGLAYARGGEPPDDLLKGVAAELMEARVYVRHMNQVTAQALEAAELDKRRCGDDTLEVNTVEHPFTFEGSRDEKLNALLVEAVNRMGGVGINAEGAYRRTVEALRERAPEAVTVIAREYETLPEEQYTDRWALIHLLHELGDASALKALDRMVRAPIPEERSKVLHEYSTRAEEMVLRTAAVEAVARLAEQQNREAQELLLRYAREGELSVRRAAVQGYLAAVGEQGREQLLEALPQAFRWLLDVRRIDVREAPQARIFDRTAVPVERELPPRQDERPAEARRPRRDGPTSTLHVAKPKAGPRDPSGCGDKPCGQ